MAPANIVEENPLHRENKLIDAAVSIWDMHEDWTSNDLLWLGMDGNDKEMTMKMLKNIRGISITFDEWSTIVSMAEINKKKMREYKIDSESLTVSEPCFRFKNPEIKSEGYWQDYADGLKSKLSYTSIMNIQESCFNLLRRLGEGPDAVVKGLVHGSVQSGKTANMGGLIAMAADNGFNIFIVFTGNITALNEQTESRLQKDLNRRGSYFDKIEFGRGSRNIDPDRKNLCVSLKNPTKIPRLITKLSKDLPNLHKYKILIIDDEGDYASVNGAREGNPRTGTNHYMMDLVNRNDKYGKPLSKKFCSINYVAYTATPYANLLNENTPESLYPRDFIVSLIPSKTYFGPQQIFGSHTDKIDYVGMPIVISSDDLDGEFRKLENEKTDSVPEELKECFAWFISAVAALRFRGFKKPLTMMINTNSSIKSHSRIADIIIDFLYNNRAEMKDYCRIVYERETERFPKSSLRTYYPDYNGDDYEKYEKDIIDYPKFSEIEGIVEHLLSERCHHIKTPDGNSSAEYYDTLHICIEDGSNKRVEGGEVFPRIRYPEEGDMCPDAPAFIAIGGNVLSRGLTLEGLIASFFLRPTKQADSLMQMGRWFGHRPTYELFPRIWMSNDTYRDFTYLSELDEDLKREIKNCNSQGSSPLKTAIRLRDVPKRCYLTSLTAKNKEKSKVVSEHCFIGKYQEFATFKNDDSVIKKNSDLTKHFLNHLEGIGISPDIPSEQDRKDGWNVVRWKGVSSKILIDEFLGKYDADLDSETAGEIHSMLLKWIKKISDSGDLDPWTILLAGKEESGKRRVGDVFEVNEHVSVRKVGRGMQKETEANTKGHSFISIKTLRSRSDIYKDVFPNEFVDRHMLRRVKENNGLDTDARVEERKMQGLEKTPLMVIYCLDHEYEPVVRAGEEIHKFKLTCNEDPVLFLVEIPNVDMDDSHDWVQIGMDNEDMEDGDSQ